MDLNFFNKNDMKKVSLFMVYLIGIILSASAQKEYTNKTQYNVALKEYNDKLSSYENYTKKVNFY